MSRDSKRSTCRAQQKSARAGGTHLAHGLSLTATDPPSGVRFSFKIMGSASQEKPTRLEHYQITFQPLLYRVASAVLLTCALKETGRTAWVPEKTLVTA